MSASFNRRLFLTGASGLVLAGCDSVTTSKPAETAYRTSSALTYRAQRALRAGKLAQEYPASAITKVFKPNGSIDPKDPAYRKLAANNFATFAMSVSGLVTKPRSFTLVDLKALPARTQITRHDCVEGWSCIGQWKGVQLGSILEIVEPKPEARFVVFRCFDRYDTDSTTDDPDPGTDLGQAAPFYGSIGMDDAVHPQTILAYEMNGQPLPVEHGAPLRVRVERQLGYKMTKYIRSIELVDSFAAIGDGKGGYWEDQGYEWYGGI
jgi:DMSO/TMAO reductase YedYZ molybdopterin-dependent catalytic subunit